MILAADAEGRRLKPHETVAVDDDAFFAGAVVDALAGRKAVLLELQPRARRVRLFFESPARRRVKDHGLALFDMRRTGS